MILGNWIDMSSLLGWAQEQFAARYRFLPIESAISMTNLVLECPRNLIHLLWEDLFFFRVGFAVLRSVGRRPKRSKTACRKLPRGHPLQ
jgi:hypothetical protein